MIVGIAGDICSGKSTVAREFEKLGAAVFDADKVAKNLLKNKTVKIKLFRLFGKDIFKNKNITVTNIKHTQIDKKKLAEIIFSNHKIRGKVEKIIHPLVRKKMYAFLKKNKNRIMVLDVPLLFEKGLNSLCDIIVFVKSKYSEILKRLKKRKLDFNDYLKRKKIQMDINKKLKLSDYIIKNTNTLKCLKLQCKKLLKKIEEDYNEKKSRNIVQ